MSEMDPTQSEHKDDGENIEEEDERTRIRNEQSARSFFALLSFLVAIILLAVFINNPLDGFSRLLVLCTIIVFGMIGTLLLDRRRRAASNSALASKSKSPDEEDEEESDLDEADEEDIEPLSPFVQLVQEALESIPAEFHEKMQNLVVIVEEEPDVEILTRGDVEEGSVLLGLYHGVPLTAQGSNGPLLPERITIYQHNIEKVCHNDPERIREQVRETVLHEVAHHFGMGHKEMPIWIR